MNLRFDAVLFDMDGTLVRTDRAWFEAERAAAADFGVEVPAEAEELLHGLDADGLVRILRERYGFAGDGGAYLEAVGVAIGDALGRAPARPGAAELVAAVADAGLPRAVVSNSPHTGIRAALAPHPWAERLSLRVSAQDVARGKPAPDAYARAAELVGVPAARCLAIEDSVAGATAAVRAGAVCVAVTHGERPAEAFAAVTPHAVASLRELLPLVRARAAAGPAPTD